MRVGRKGLLGYPYSPAEGVFSKAVLDPHNLLVQTPDHGPGLSLADRDVLAHVSNLSNRRDNGRGTGGERLGDCATAAPIRDISYRNWSLGDRHPPTARDLDDRVARHPCQYRARQAWRNHFVFDYEEDVARPNFFDIPAFDRV